MSADFRHLDLNAIAKTFIEATFNPEVFSHGGSGPLGLPGEGGTIERDIIQIARLAQQYGPEFVNALDRVVRASNTEKQGIRDILIGEYSGGDEDDVLGAFYYPSDDLFGQSDDEDWAEKNQIRGAHKDFGAGGTMGDPQVASEYAYNPNDPTHTTPKTFQTPIPKETESNPEGLDHTDPNHPNYPTKPGPDGEDIPLTEDEIQDIQDNPKPDPNVEVGPLPEVPPAQQPKPPVDIDKPTPAPAPAPADPAAPKAPEAPAQEEAAAPTMDTPDPIAQAADRADKAVIETRKRRNDPNHKPPSTLKNRAGGGGGKMFDLQGARMERKMRDYEEAQLDAKIKAHEDLVEEKRVKEAKADAARRHPELAKNPYVFGDGIEKPQVPPMKPGGEPGTYSEHADPFAADFANKEDGEVVAEGTIGSAQEKAPGAEPETVTVPEGLEKSPSGTLREPIDPADKVPQPKDGETVNVDSPDVLPGKPVGEPRDPNAEPEAKPGDAARKYLDGLNEEIAQNKQPEVSIDEPQPTELPGTPVAPGTDADDLLAQRKKEIQGPHTEFFDTQKVPVYSKDGLTGYRTKGQMKKDMGGKSFKRIIPGAAEQAQIDSERMANMENPFGSTDFLAQSREEKRRQKEEEERRKFGLPHKKMGTSRISNPFSVS